MLIYHEFLVEGTDFEHCAHQVRRFIDLYELVAYKWINPLPERSCPASSPIFAHRISEALAENRNILRSFIKELSALGLRDIDELAHLKQGYQSKVLHIVTHFLDGFFGIDSCFYNLVDGSHWIFSDTEKRLMAEPDKFWLIAVDASTGQGMQGLEEKAPSSVIRR